MFKLYCNILADKLYKLMKVQLPEIKLDKDRKINIKDKKDEKDL